MNEGYEEPIGIELGERFLLLCRMTDAFAAQRRERMAKEKGTHE